MSQVQPWWTNVYHDGAAFTWDLLYTCNYRCSYCWWDPHWEHLVKSNPVHSVETWARCWQRVHENHGTVRIDILGGEPFLYPGFTDLIAQLVQWHKILVTSNLSVAYDTLESFLDRVTPGRFHINASYHPQFATLDAFMKKAYLLKSRGFDPGVLVVSHPTYLEELPEMRRYFKGLGFPFTTLVFRGEYNGKPYPESFTPAQKAIVQENIEAEGKTRISYRKFQLDRDNTFGRMCYTGAVYANVKPTGDVFRCGRDQTALKPIGNIFDPEFRLPPAPTPCPFQNCSCQEYIYIKEEYEPYLERRKSEAVA